MIEVKGKKRIKTRRKINPLASMARKDFYGYCYPIGTQELLTIVRSWSE
jgi:hypothetical protein